MRHQQNEDLSVEIINRQGLNIRLTSMARTFVDVLDRPELSGGWEEVYRSINSMVALNINEVIRYCLKLDNSRLVAKVGFILEQRKGAFAVTDQQLAPLLATKPKSPEYLSQRTHRNGVLIKKWNLIVPKNILNQSWEEPNVDI